MVISTVRNRLFALLRDTSGNFGIMTAVLLPVSIGVVGLGLDVTTMVQNKRTLQNAVDSAALATATAMANGLSKSDAEAMAKSFIASQMANALGDTVQLSATPTITTTTQSSTDATYNVGLTGSYTMTMNPLSQAMGWNTVNIAAYGKAVATTGTSDDSDGNPLSMYLVLDRSGSMDDYPSYTTTCEGQYNTRRGTQTYYYQCVKYYSNVKKIDSLKLAVQTLANQLNTADPDHKYVRTGADSYSTYADSPKAMAFGTSHVVSYVNALVADGGTDATQALENAYLSLNKSNQTEAKAHGTSDFKRFVIFMTDGEMTGNSSVWNSTIDANVRQKCTKIKNDSIEIYTIAFNAPDNGKSLLAACATDENHYYEADDTAKLVAVFGEIGKKTTKRSTRLTN
ncbi:Flp pilus assembly protein TadG/uncharacterized protein YegL [Agrobacterium vitis]|nr:Flp pilus assembly protein TadG/uncharacterized protein YegL [Agrobacterium vitis]MBE1436813.1 Flp pilus assembly protein TadG/uncharacterized protein YegL [Agrobacterium vitis]